MSTTRFIKTSLASAIVALCAGLGGVSSADAQTYGGSLRPVAQNRSVASTQVRQVQPAQQRVVTRTTQVNRAQVINRPVRVSRPVRNQRWVEPPRGSYRVQTRAFPRNARWQTDPRTYAVYSIYNGDVWYLDPTTGWGYTVDRWGVVYSADPRTSWVYSLGELSRWTSDLLYFFDYYSYDRGYWRADYYNDYSNYWRSPRATFYNWDTAYDRVWGYNNYFVSQTFVTQTTTFSQTYVQNVNREVIYERANPAFVQQQVSAVGVAALQAAAPAQLSTAFVPTSSTIQYAQVEGLDSSRMIPVVDGQTAAFVEPLAVGEPVPQGATVFTEQTLKPVEAAPLESYESLPVQAVDTGAGYTDSSGAKPVDEVQPDALKPASEPLPISEPTPYVDPAKPEQASVEPAFEDGGQGKQPDAVLERQAEPSYEEPAQPYEQPAFETIEQGKPSAAEAPQIEPAYEQPANEQPAQQQPVYEQPAYEEKGPDVEVERQAEPVYEQAEPAYEQPQERIEQAEPQYEQQAQPAYEQPEPAYEAPQERFEQAEPAYEQQQYEPAYQQPEPAYEAPQESFQQQEPAYEAPQESFQQQEPAYEQPAEAAPEPQQEEETKETIYE